jgi:hypothetical protein
MKKWTQSKMIWFNVLTGLMQAAMVLDQYLYMLQLDPTMVVYVQQGIGAIQIVGNIVLRFKTSEGIH